MFMIRKKMKNKSGRWFLIVFFCLGLSLHSLEKAQISGDSIISSTARGKEKTSVTGNAVVETKDYIIKADKIELYGAEHDYIECFGTIDVQNQKEGLHIKSNRLIYNRKEKRIKFYENAIMEDLENELIVKGDYIENWEDEEITIIQIGVRIIKKDMICRSEMARYVRKEDRLELSGIPRVFKEGKQEIKALKINIDLKNDNIIWEGGVKGEVTMESEKDSDEPEVVTDEKSSDRANDTKNETDEKLGTKENESNNIGSEIESTSFETAKGIETDVPKDSSEPGESLLKD